MLLLGSTSQICPFMLTAYFTWKVVTKPGSLLTLKLNCHQTMRAVIPWANIFPALVKANAAVYLGSNSQWCRGLPAGSRTNPQKYFKIITCNNWRTWESNLFLPTTTKWSGKLFSSLACQKAGELSHQADVKINSVCSKNKWSSTSSESSGVLSNTHTQKPEPVQ